MGIKNTRSVWSVAGYLSLSVAGPCFVARIVLRLTAAVFDCSRLVVEWFFGGDVECWVVDAEGVEVAVVVWGVGGVVMVVHFSCPFVYTRLILFTCC